MPSSAYPPLLRLPREIRDDIYHYAFLGTCIWFSECEFWFHLIYEGVTWCTFPCKIGHTHTWHCHGNRKNNWILANQQIYFEAASQFLRNGTCDEHNHDKTKARSSFPAFSFTRVQRLATEVELEVGFAGESAFVYQKKPTLEKLCLFIQTLDFCALKRIELVIDFAHYDRYRLKIPDVDEIRSWRVDLSFLEMLGTGYDTIHICSHAPYVDAWHKNDVRAYMILVPLLYKEAGRIAGVLVGNKGWIMKNWWAPYEPNDDWSSWYLDVKRAGSHIRLGEIGDLSMDRFEGQDEIGNLAKYRLLPDQGDEMARFELENGFPNYSPKRVILRKPAVT